MTAPARVATRRGHRGRVNARTLPHVGEWKIELRGDTRDEVFRRVVTLIACVSGHVSGPLGDWEPVTLSARDDAALLVDWANELIGRGEASSMAYGDVRDVELTPPAGRASPDWRLTAQVRGRPVRQWRSPLKAATYHGVRLERRDSQWYATLLFDI